MDKDTRRELRRKYSLLSESGVEHVDVLDALDMSERDFSEVWRPDESTPVEPVVRATHTVDGKRYVLSTCKKDGMLETSIESDTCSPTVLRLSTVHLQMLAKYVRDNAEGLACL